MCFLGCKNWGQSQLKCLSSQYELPGKSQSCSQVNLTSNFECYVMLSIKNLVCPHTFSNTQFVLWQANCWHCLSITTHCLKRRKTAGKCHKHNITQEELWLIIKPNLHIKENLKYSGCLIINDMIYIRSHLIFSLVDSFPSMFIVLLTHYLNMQCLFQFRRD